MFFHASQASELVCTPCATLQKDCRTVALPLSKNGTATPARMRAAPTKSKTRRSRHIAAAVEPFAVLVRTSMAYRLIKRKHFMQVGMSMCSPKRSWRGSFPTERGQSEEFQRANNFNVCPEAWEMIRRWGSWQQLRRRSEGSQCQLEDADMFQGNLATPPLWTAPWSDGNERALQTMGQMIWLQDHSGQPGWNPWQSCQCNTITICSYFSLNHACINGHGTTIRGIHKPRTGRELRTWRRCGFAWVRVKGRDVTLKPRF